MVLEFIFLFVFFVFLLFHLWENKANKGPKSTKSTKSTKTVILEAFSKKKRRRMRKKTKKVVNKSIKKGKQIAECSGVTKKLNALRQTLRNTRNMMLDKTNFKVKRNGLRKLKSNLIEESKRDYIFVRGNVNKIRLSTRFSRKYLEQGKRRLLNWKSYIEKNKNGRESQNLILMNKIASFNIENPGSVVKNLNLESVVWEKKLNSFSKSIEKKIERVDDIIQKKLERKVQRLSIENGKLKNKYGNMKAEYKIIN